MTDEKQTRPVVIISVIILLLQISYASAQLLDLPLEDDLYREAYDFIDRMVASGYIKEINKNTRPYSQDEVIKILKELHKKSREDIVKLSKVEKQRLNSILSELSQKDYLFQTQGEKHQFGVNFGIGEDIIHRRQESDENKTGYATLFNPIVEGQMREDFAFRSDLKVYHLSATQFPDIPKTEVRMSQPAKETKTASLSNYYIKAKLPWFSLFFGHDNLHWGPGRHGALLLSKNPTPMNMFKLQAKYYPVKFEAVQAKLGSDIDSKYLAGHRLEFNLWDKLHLGIAETVVYGHRFETIYLNPVQFYTTTEFVFPSAGGENDNVLISGDIDLVPLKNLELYGEVLIDDYRPFSYTPKNWGNKFGLLFGGYWVNPLGIVDTDLRLEYAFVNQYAYTHTTKINAYTHFNSPIGHQIGTDADDLWLKLKHWFTANIATSITYEMERHGEGDVNQPHEKEEGRSDSDEWEFLSGVTESTHSISLCVTCNMIGTDETGTGKYSMDLKYTRSWIRNASNQDGVNDSRNQVLLSGQYRF